MKIIHALKAPVAEKPRTGSARPVYNSPHAAAVHLTLKPGESVWKNDPPVDVFFYVLEGTGTVEVGTESAEVSRDMLIESPAGTMHRLANRGTEPFCVLVVRAQKAVAYSDQP